MKIRRVVLSAAIVGLIVAIFQTWGHAQTHYPAGVVGAWTSTSWSDDSTRCAVVVEVENLQRETMTAAPSNQSGGQCYVFPTIIRGSLMSDQGKPELPLVQVNLEIPPGARVSFTIDKIDKRDEWDKMDITPATAPWREVRGVPQPVASPDVEVYGRNRFFPYHDVVRLGEQSTVRDKTFQTIYFYPVRYNPSLRLVHLSRIEATMYLTFEGGTSKSNWQNAANKQRAAYSSAFAGTMSLLVEGYRQPDKELPRTERDSGCDYLAIVPDPLEKDLQPLMDLKRKRNLRTKIVNFTSMNINASDSAESRRDKIRSRIEAEYKLEPKPSYLLLVGDSVAIPPYYKTRHPYYHNEWVATDLFYTTLDGGEWHPSLAVGRLPARNSDELKIMISKTLNYEKAIDENSNKPVWGDAIVAAEYENSMVSLGGVQKTSTGRWFHQTAYNCGQFLRSKMSNVTQRYVAYNPNLPKPWYNLNGTPIPQDVIDKFCTQDQAVKDIHGNWVNNTRLILHRDHGSDKGWACPRFDVSEVALLKKPKLFPVVLSINCETGWYDKPTGSSFALDLMRNPHGASAVIAASRVSYSGHNDRFTEGLMKAIWEEFEFDFLLPETLEAKRIGPVLNYAKEYLMKSYKQNDTTSKITLQLFNLFGDPEMRIDRPSVGENLERSVPEGMRTIRFKSSFDKGYR